MRLHLVSIVLLAAGCGAGDKGEEADPPSDGKADSFSAATDHGVIVFGDEVATRITTSERKHFWTFELVDDAHIIVATTPKTVGQAEVDTVLYLYRQTSDGSWGRYAERNDDADASTVWSRIDRNATAGTFRVLVKGHDNDALGSFKVSVDCDGRGCGYVPTCEEIESYIHYNHCGPEDVQDLGDVELCLRETPDWGDVVELADACCMEEPELVFCPAL